MLVNLSQFAGLRPSLGNAGLVPRWKRTGMNSLYTFTFNLKLPLLSLKLSLALFSLKRITLLNLPFPCFTYTVLCFHLHFQLFYLNVHLLTPDSPTFTLFSLTLTLAYIHLSLVFITLSLVFTGTFTCFHLHFHLQELWAVLLIGSAGRS